MIRQLVAALDEVGVEIDAEAIADALWLARVRREESREGEQQSPSAVRPVPTEPRPPDAEPQDPVDDTHAESGDGQEPGRSVATSQAGPGPKPGASSITLPKAHALPGTLELGRALRPLKQRHPSKRRRVLNADATIEYFCDTGVLTPVMLPGAERWFDVDVLVDVGPSMAVWQDTAAKLVSFLQRHGAFREVRRWNLEQPDETVRLSRGADVRSEAAQLVDPHARRLTMVLTDCIGPMWYQAPIWEAIRGWGMFSPAVVISPLPSRLWPRTALGSPEITMRSRRPGGANRLLDVTLPWWWPGRESPLSAVPVPVITLDAAQVATWARMAMGAGGVECTGVFAAPPTGMAAPRSGNGPPDADEQVRRFRVTMSPVAYRLAVYLSAVLRNRWGLGLARVLQEAMLPDSGQVHLAEVLVGGLVRQAERTGGQAEPAFEFIDGVANVLRRSLTGTEALRMLQALGGHIERETGRSPGIAALLLGETTPADAAEEFGDVLAGAASLIDAMGLARAGGVPQPMADSLIDTTEEASDRPAYLSNLGIELRTRFNRSGQQADLDEAIALFREAVAAASSGHPDRPGYLSNLGNVVLTRFDRSGQQADLDEAIALFREAVDAATSGHPNRPRRISDLVNVPETRFEHAGQQADLDVADVAMIDEIDEEARVLTLLRRLPLRQRQIAALVYDGYTPREIASLLGMEPNAVRATLHNARERLKEYLAQDAGQVAAEQERPRPVPTPAAFPSEQMLAIWLVRQRWFAGKGRTVHDLAIVADTEIVWGDPGLRHLIVTASYGATSDSYQIFVGSRARLPARLRSARIGTSMGMQIYDALYDTTLTQTLLDAIAGDRTVGTLRFSRFPGAEIQVGLDSQVLTSEQRNTSVVFGRSAIFKVFRRVTPGPNPDLEVTAALARLGSSHIAEPYGWVETRMDGATTVLAIMSRYLRAASDGWSLAAASVRDLYAAEDARAAEVGGDFAGEAERLGAATAQVHQELAEAFGVSELQPEAISELAEQMFRRLDISLAAMPELARYADKIGDAYSSLARLEGPVPTQRVHGDYHLGEVVRTQSGWVVLDFEGDPATPLAQRRARSSPLRDVADMLRSFEYAARSQLIMHPHATPELAAAASDWVRRNSDAFCAGYTATGGLDLAENSVLLHALLLDKAVNEVVYEARNRPSWLPIPLEFLADF